MAEVVRRGRGADEVQSTVGAGAEVPQVKRRRSRAEVEAQVGPPTYPDWNALYPSTEIREISVGRSRLVPYKL